MTAQSRITAVLGPTNTGKTHYAIERMLAHRTGVIGLPLRLLAREVYDRIVAARGPSVAALVTGEERIVGERAQYWVCTVEAMPTDIGADFLAVDEIQLCADPERGHVFTDRLLNARGLHETLFLGSDTMRPAIAALVPRVQFLRRERFSTLTYAGSKKLSRMPARSAIVSFSVENLYAIAELIRRQRGGCAVVMGALSPRTRNAQVALYQNGDVDFLVATDAIGMGLNLDIGHVAFSATSKFDGRRIRHLFPHELAQIAGRAGRHMAPGTFGVTGEAHPLPDEVVEAVENHRFQPIQRLHWRSGALDFGSADRLIASLEVAPQSEWLTRGRDADDLSALKALTERPEIASRARAPADVRLLWDVCRIPDFRAISANEHAVLLARIFDFLQGQGRVPSDWLAAQIQRIDRAEGEIDTLSRRLAFIRTWTYVAQRRGWVDDENHWREETRAVEDRLSDALHARLTQRFVDRRTSVLLRRLKQKESLVAEVNDKGEVTVEGEFVGRIEGFRFQQDASASADEGRTLRQAAYEALKPEFHLRADRFYNAPDTELDFTDQGGLMWGSHAVGKLVKGPEVLKPQVAAFVDEEAGPDVAGKVRRRLQHFIDRKIAAAFEPLLAMGRDEALQGLARGLAFRLAEQLGVLPRDGVADEVKALDQEARGALRKHGVRFGQFTVFLPLLLKPAPTRLRLLLWSLASDLPEFLTSPPPGLVTIPNIAEVARGNYILAGYHPAGARAIRIDMLERLADLLRQKDSRAGFEATPDMLSITGMTLEQFADLMGGLGYRAERGEREKVRAEPVAAPAEAGDGPANPIPEGEAAILTVTEPEIFYTFTWAPKPRPRPERGNRRQGAAPQGGAPGEAGERREARPRREGERRDRRPEKKPEGDRPDHKKGPRPGRERREEGARSFEARPPKKADRIDPDNPFAAALMGLRDKI
ncbi:MAG: helicase [Proteobacteria bacterium]|nr:helicase [Pseudomonadota bacterium]MBS0572374.1 helicase [Pseudomonadota bacterium]